MYKHLIFDLDGTVANTLPCIRESVNLTLSHFHMPYHYNDKEVNDFVGYGTYYLIRKAFQDDNLSNIEEVLDFYLPIQAQIHKEKVEGFPKLLTVLEQLKSKGYLLYIATNKPIEVGPPTIERIYGKNFFKDAEYPSRSTPKKPDPYVLNQIIIRNNLKPNECLYIGDSEVDLLTAKNAGVDSCLVKYGYGRYGHFDESLAKFIVHCPEDLLKYLR